jgi:hypothetical protein
VASDSVQVFKVQGKLGIQNPLPHTGVLHQFQACVMV